MGTVVEANFLNSWCLDDDFEENSIETYGNRTAIVEDPSEPLEAPWISPLSIGAAPEVTPLRGAATVSTSASTATNSANSDSAEEVDPISICHWLVYSCYPEAGDSDYWRQIYEQNPSLRALIETMASNRTIHDHSVESSMPRASKVLTSKELKPRFVEGGPLEAIFRIYDDIYNRQPRMHEIELLLNDVLKWNAGPLDLRYAVGQAARLPAGRYGLTWPQYITKGAIAILRKRVFGRRFNLLAFNRQSIHMDLMVLDMVTNSTMMLEDVRALQQRIVELVSRS